MAAAMIFESDSLNYVDAPKWVHAQSIYAGLACQDVLMGATDT